MYLLSDSFRFKLFHIVLLVILNHNLSAVTFKVTRLNNGLPLVTHEHFVQAGVEDEGKNINGPSVISVPEWIAPGHRADSTARYYMYFADHRGNYIRLAWAVQVEGPWNLYDVGPGIPLGDRGVLDLGEKTIQLGNGIAIPNNHIASPDVHVDDEHQRIIMYFHSGSGTRVNGIEIDGQKTYVATSKHGLEFKAGIDPVILGPSYFRVFEYQGDLYSIDNGGDLNKALSLNNPWTPPAEFDFTSYLWTRAENDPFQQDLDEAGPPDSDFKIRHSTVHLIGDTLYVFYTRKNDPPERILMSVIDLSIGNYELWDPNYPPKEILRAELDWEGGDLPALPSEGGKAPENVNQLRDPYIFQDKDNKLYLFYIGRGEDAIGLAAVEIDNPTLLVDKHSVQPGAFELLQNFPNPFNGETTLSYHVRQSTRIELSIRNSAGRLVKTLIDAYHHAGEYSVKWDGTTDDGLEVSSGLYIGFLKAEDFVKIVKISYLK